MATENQFTCVCKDCPGKATHLPRLLFELKNGDPVGAVLPLPHCSGHKEKTSSASELLVDGGQSLRDELEKAGAVIGALSVQWIDLSTEEGRAAVQALREFKSIAQ